MIQPMANPIDHITTPYANITSPVNPGDIRLSLMVALARL
jgi:hypothetical protein